MPLLTSDREGARTLDLTPQSRGRYRLSHGDYCYQTRVISIITYVIYDSKNKGPRGLIGRTHKSGSLEASITCSTLPWSVRKDIHNDSVAENSSRDVWSSTSHVQTQLWNLCSDVP
ncbi:hypothetical protein SK128_018876 [Halocaridina rubra]|uniref:Uncharacterized protein n=1 Tax=Halocaridina rubra TaxID=373956 RepID=A0AAN9A2Q9_HALRR